MAQKKGQQSFTERAEIKGSGVRFIGLILICVVLVIIGEYFGCILSP